MEEVQHAGQTYLRQAIGQAGHDLADVFTLPTIEPRCWRPDDLLRSADRGPQRAEGPALLGRGLEPGCQGADQCRAGDALAAPPAQPGAKCKLGTIAPLLEKARAYAVGINLDRELTADVVATVGEAEDVKPVTETFQALLTLGRNAVPSLKEHAADAGQLREANDWAIGTARRRCSTTRASRQRGRRYGCKPVHPSTLPMRPVSSARSSSSAQTASTRAQSVNNLKQIGLAFHNFADEQEPFPAARALRRQERQGAV